MTGRERMKRAIMFLGPDRIPHGFRDVFPLFNLPPMSWQPPEPYYPYVHPLAIKFRAWKPRRKLPKNWTKLDRTAIDEWGTIWRASAISTLGEVIHGPLEDGWRLLDSYRPPDMSDWSRYKLCYRLGKLFGGSRYRLSVDNNSIWERFRFLRGFGNANTDLIEYPNEVHRLLEMLTDMTIVVVGMFHRAGAHGFMLVDDWGTQKTSFISPKHFAEFFKPCYRRIADRCHELGMNVGIHSCGCIRPVVPGLIEAGMDFLQLDSPLMCGIDWLAENVSGKVALFLSPDIQTIYPLGSDEELEDHIREMIAKLGDFNGGLVAWPYSEPGVIGVHRERVKLQMRLFKKYGGYPLNCL